MNRVRSALAAWGLALVGVLLAWSGSAVAEPLNLAELLQLEEHLECRRSCQYGRPASFDSCVSDCGASEPKWDKDLDQQVNEADRRLAVLEYWDDGALTQICLRDGAVLPLVDCEPCLAQHTELGCLDEDGDGLARYQEQLLGTSDNQPTRGCNTGLDCAGFSEVCRLGAVAGAADARAPAQVVANRVLCLPRECPSSGCTAFHLEEVAQDNQRVLVHVYFDYAPVPPRVLDLRVQYDPSRLTLVDARPLAALLDADKELSSTHSSADTLRLVALGTSSLRPIEPGPVAELVFSRNAGAAGSSTIAFSSVDGARRSALAPSQNVHTLELSRDSLWGRAVGVAPTRPDGDRLLLHYSFDQINRPQSYADVLSADELCNFTNITGRCEERSQFEALQRGSVRYSAPIEGVSGQGAFFDGFSDHLELPVTLARSQQLRSPPQSSDQSFTFSTWFFVEGDVGRGSDLHEGQVLFSHNAQGTETTRFGLMTRALPGEDAFELLWFEGDLGSQSLEPILIATGLGNRRWRHVALQIDMSRAPSAAVLLGGEPVFERTFARPTPLSCPQFDPFRFQQQGSALGSRAPEALYFSAADNNLFGVERMDSQGFGRVELIREPDSSAQDADYSPVLDMLVFSSTASGDREIWLANGDGSGREQLTFGFGDAQRGMVARRPRWAPDGSGLVFESNVASPGEGVNLAGVYQLYFVPFDGERRQVAVQLSGESTPSTTLQYARLLASQTLGEVRLTNDGSHHQNAHWLRGVHSVGGQHFLGELVLTRVSGDLEARSPERLRIYDRLVGKGSASPFDPFGGSKEGARVSVLAAQFSAGSDQVTQERQLLQLERAEFAPTSEYTLRQSTSADGRRTDVSIEFTPTELCWDKNANGICDFQSEDTSGNGVCEPEDCRPVEIRDLYLRLPPDILPLRDEAGDLIVSSPDPFVEESAKELSAEVLFAAEANLIKIEMLSPVNGDRVPPGTTIAALAFDSSGASRSQFLPLLSRRVTRELHLAIDDKVERLRVDGSLQQILEADFSPDGRQMVVSALVNSRPVVAIQDVVPESAREASLGLHIVSERPTRVRGLQWAPVEKLYPCNWVGAFRNPATGGFFSGFRGGLDELKVHSYLVPAEVFRSEVARGTERLAKAGRDTLLASSGQSCSDDLDCPSHELCRDKDTAAGKQRQCTVVACGPDAVDADDFRCAPGSSCNLLPLPLGGGSDSFGWVCSAECKVEGQCFEQQCANGPCRFCGEGTGTCEECRVATDEVLGFEFVEGCPDRNSFACEYGNCTTECFSVADEQSTYLCDPLTEFCRQGKCELRDWNWADLAPATFSGLGEMALGNPNLPVTTAVSQLYPITVEAFGVADYLHPPELVVEGLASAAVGGAYNETSNESVWFEIGRILVHNKTMREAEARPYTVQTPFPVSELRLRLITPPYTNLSRGGTGLLDKVGSFCGEANRADCERQASGSRANLGYRASVPRHEALRACSQRAAAGEDCGYDGRFTEYLHGGQPTAIVTGIEILGTSVFNDIDTNLICPYLDANGNITIEPQTARPGRPAQPNRILYGDASQEVSAQRSTLYPEARRSDELRSFTAELKNKRMALLNCNFGRASDPDASLAHVHVQLPPILYPDPAVGVSDGRSITETANGCNVESASGATQPCFEWVGGPTLDTFTATPALYRTLDWDSFSSFGYCNPRPEGSQEAYDCEPG